MTTFVERLIAAIREKGAPVCVGIDAILPMMPDTRTSHSLDADRIHEFGQRLLRVVAPLVPAVKIQSAYCERQLWEGCQVYYDLIAAARKLGLIVIGDVKRGDIGSTSEAYADAHLADHPEPFCYPTAEGPDAITVNPMLGLDTLEPFIKVCERDGKGIFVLVRTSNPGSAVLQDVKLGNGLTWSEHLAMKLNEVIEARGDAGANPSGYSSIGAVVGATQPRPVAAIRKLLPNSYFLLPGYGTQGATAEMTRAAFDGNGLGALISASRSIIYAHGEKKYSDRFADWEDSVRQAVLDMKEDVLKVLNR